MAHTAVPQGVTGTLTLSGVLGNISLPAPENDWNKVESVVELKVWAVNTFNYSFDNNSLNAVSVPADTVWIINLAHKQLHAEIDPVTRTLHKVFFSGTGLLHFEVVGTELRATNS